jgi:hypothetical protein
VILLGTVTLNGKQLYYLEQASDYVPFPVVAAGTTPPYDPQVPQELRGLTNSQIYTTYGLAIGGIVAPPATVVVPKIHAVIADPATYPAPVTLQSAKYTNNLTGYLLSYKDANGKRVKETTPTALREGWNLLTRTASDGSVRTFLVYGDVTPPTFTLDKSIVLTINPVDLKTGIYIEGTVTDNSTGSQAFRQQFSDLDQLTVKTKTNADGTTVNYITLTFTIKDRAGNATVVSLDIVIDPNAPLQENRGFQDLPPKPVSVTLLSLLGFIDDRLQ